MTPHDHQLRTKTISGLQLLASEEKQLEYLKSAPNALVPAELFSIWFIDVAYSDSAISTYGGSFSEAEMKHLNKFHKAFKRAAIIIDPLPLTVPDLQKLSAWKRVTKAAQTCLDHFHAVAA